MSGVENWMPSVASGAGRSVAPVGPTVMPGAVGMPLLDIVGVPASAVAPPEELPEELEDVVLPPELLTPLLLPPVEVPPLELPPEPEEPLTPPPPLLDMSVDPEPCPEPGKLVVGPAELHARKPRARTRPAPDKTRFNFGLLVCIMTSPPSLLGFVRGAIDDSPTRELLSPSRQWA